MGAPKKEIDFAEFEKLCSLLCTEDDIANFFKISVDTLNARCKEHYGFTFSDTYKKYSVLGRISLRRAQMAAAEKGNPTMLIWLGKQYLGQRDKLTEDDSKLLNEEIEFISDQKTTPREVIAKFLNKRIE